MIAIQTDQYFDSICRILVSARGKANAVTIDQIALRLGLTKTHPRTGAPVPDRRPVEAAISNHWDDFPFLLVSGSAGLWIAEDADDLNKFVHNIRSRHQSLRAKDESTCRKAKARGFNIENGKFIDPPASRQTELFL